MLFLKAEIMMMLRDNVMGDKWLNDDDDVWLVFWIHKTQHQVACYLFLCPSTGYFVIVLFKSSMECSLVIIWDIFFLSAASVPAVIGSFSGFCWINLLLRVCERERVCLRIQISVFIYLSLCTTPSAAISNIVLAVWLKPACPLTGMKGCDIMPQT